MKTIQQLLHLSKNPFYKFSPDEKAVLDDFLLQPLDSLMKKSQKKHLKRLSPRTHVTVRNIVKKVDTYAPESHENAQDER